MESSTPSNRRHSTASTLNSAESLVITNRIKNIYKQSRVASQSTFPMLSELVFQILITRNVEHDDFDNSSKIQANLAFPKKLIFLDLKTPETEPDGSEVAKRIGQQLIDLMASVPEQGMLVKIQQEIDFQF